MSSMCRTSDSVVFGFRSSSSLGVPFCGWGSLGLGFWWCWCSPVLFGLWTPAGLSLPVPYVQAGSGIGDKVAEC